MPDVQNFDCAITGAGPAGLAAGLACAEMGLATAVIGPRADPRDGRTAALFQSSVQFLKRLGVWDAIAPAAAPLDAIRLIDATGALIRAPEVTFRASEIGLEAFGYNVPNVVLTSALESATRNHVTHGRLTRVETKAVTALAISDSGVAVTTHEGREFSALLAAAADGRASPSRTAAAITTRAWAYDQSAVVCSFTHSRPHANISTEFHRRTGPLTVVPGPGSTSSLVWVETPTEARRLAELSGDAFAAALAHHLSGLLGQISAVSPRGIFPLSGQTATTLAKNRVALIGEAAHVMPPIGAQGLNLSFRDAATLAEIAAGARGANEDIGSPPVLARYDAARSRDVTSRVWTIDLLNRSLLSEFAPVHLARGLGLFALSAIGPLRRFVMREGVAPALSTPQLMQPPGEPAVRGAATLDAGTAPQA